MKPQESILNKITQATNEIEVEQIAREISHSLMEDLYEQHINADQYMGALIQLTQLKNNQLSVVA